MPQSSTTRRHWFAHFNAATRQQPAGMLAAARAGLLAAVAIHCVSASNISGSPAHDEEHDAADLLMGALDVSTLFAEEMHDGTPAHASRSLEISTQLDDADYYLPDEDGAHTAHYAQMLFSPSENTTESPQPWIGPEDAASSGSPSIYDVLDAHAALAREIAALRSAVASRVQLVVDATPSRNTTADWPDGTTSEAGVHAAIDYMENKGRDAASRIVALIQTLPEHNRAPPIAPKDRRAVRGPEVSIATYNCMHLRASPHASVPWTTDAARLLHMLYVARVLDALDADVVVLNEVEAFGAAEAVRLLMANGGQYRAYCTQKTDARLRFRPVLLSRIDPVEPLGSIADAQADDLRHFVARLHVWRDDSGDAHWPLDVVGVHLPRISKTRLNIERATALRDALVRRRNHLARSGVDIPIVVAGDLNSRYVHQDPQNTRKYDRERPRGLYTLHEDTGLVGCFLDGPDSETFRGGAGPIDHVLVPAVALHPQRSIHCQLRTTVHTHEPGFPPVAYASDHWPVSVVLSFEKIPLEDVDDSWCALDDAGWKARRRRSLDRPLPSFLSSDHIANEHLLRTLSQEKMALARSSADSVRSAGRASRSASVTRSQSFFFEQDTTETSHPLAAQPSTEVIAHV